MIDSPCVQGHSERRGRQSEREDTKIKNKNRKGVSDMLPSAYPVHPSLYSGIVHVIALQTTCPLFPPKL